MSRVQCVIIMCAGYLGLLAQEKPYIKPEKSEYDRKEEIIYDGKRYRIHNSYLNVGAGLMQSSIRTGIQRILGIDFHFPIRRSHFQVGVMMSGESFGSNNNIQGHICYGLRKETEKSNLAIFAGPSYHTGVVGDVASGLPIFYQNFGIYGGAQAVRKISYDIGLGVELFGDISNRQRIVGLKAIVFFSGAYRGLKKNFNPHVRSENPK